MKKPERKARKRFCQQKKNGQKDGRFLTDKKNKAAFNLGCFPLMTKKLELPVFSFYLDCPLISPFLY